MSHGRTKPCSVEVSENVWLHIRDLPFMSKEARNVTLGCLEELISQAVPLEKKGKSEGACREVLEAVVVLVLSEPAFHFCPLYHLSIQGLGV